MRRQEPESGEVEGARFHETEGGCKDGALENFRGLSLGLQGASLQGRARTNRKFPVQLPVLAQGKGFIPTSQSREISENDRTILGKVLGSLVSVLRLN